MVFHVLIEFNNKNKVNRNYILIVDIDSEENLKEDFISPYINNTDFFIEGYTFKKEDINRFLIKKSNTLLKFEAEEKKRRKYSEDKVSGIADFRNHDFLLYTFMDKTFTEDVTKDLLKKYQLLVNENKIEKSNKKFSKKMDTVFIVHGQDNELKNEIARFIEEIGLNTIILHEKENKGDTIIEKIERYSEEANYAIILYTPCDKGCKNNENDLKPRARQNVIFEHGYFVAKFGRKNVVAILKDNVEIPSDISGIVYINYKDYKFDLMKELKSVGFNINI